MEHQLAQAPRLKQVVVKKGSAAFPQGDPLGAFEIDLPVETHQQLHGLNLRIVRVQCASLMHELIRQILDGVAQDLKRMPSFTAQAPRAVDLDQST